MIGQTVAHYRVTSKLGEGGMGEVYRAMDTNLDREVAIKVLPLEVAQDYERRQRFLTEAKAASALNHPNICTVYEVGEFEDGRPYIAMEFLSGKTLEQSRGLLPSEVILDIGTQIAEALDAAHSAGIVHRDVKPSNISIDENGRVKVLDFGLAKRLIGPDTTDPESPTQLLTLEGQIIGTPAFMSPEQALGEPVDQRSDLFSLGAVLYQLATDHSPFTGASFGDTVNKIINLQPPPIADHNQNVTAELERIIRKCLAKDRERRYQASRELLVDLQNLMREGSTSSVMRASRVSREKRTWAARALALVLIAMFAVLELVKDLFPQIAFFGIRRPLFSNSQGREKEDVSCRMQRITTTS